MTGASFTTPAVRAKESVATVTALELLDCCSRNSSDQQWNTSDPHLSGSDEHLVLLNEVVSGSGDNLSHLDRRLYRLTSISAYLKVGGAPRTEGPRLQGAMCTYLDPSKLRTRGFAAATCTNASRGCTNSLRGCTNSLRGCTNSPRDCTNASRGCTNAPRGCTNAPRGCTNSPRGCTNSPRGCTNASRDCTNSPHLHDLRIPGAEIEEDFLSLNRDRGPLEKSVEAGLLEQAKGHPESKQRILDRASGRRSSQRGCDSRRLN